MNVVVKGQANKPIVPYSECVNAQCYSVGQIVADAIKTVEPSLPSGFVYIQYPGQSEPGELWPNDTWENISSCFPGLFFRAEGGNACAFNNGSQGQATSATGITASLSSYTWNHCHPTTPYNIYAALALFTNTCGSTNALSCTGCVTFSASGTTTCNGLHCHSITLSSTDSETRPVNYTIRIWRKL